uniref:Uncharacterized protein n=1 Tax=Magallana gigas TaxID=29159 RepID=K1R676_MAGGI
MDDDFVEYVELLVQYIFSRNMLVTKQMNGREMKGKDLMMYMKAFVSYFNDDKSPSPETALKVMWVVLTPSNSKSLNIFKTVELPTLKPYILLFLVSRGIKRLLDKFVYGLYATQVTVKANWPLVINA